MINTPAPPQIADLIARLEAAKALKANDEGEAMHQLAEDVREHLEGVARPLYRKDKGAEHEPPSYAFGAPNAQKAKQALPYVTALQSALEQSDFERALSSARKIQSFFP